MGGSLSAIMLTANGQSTVVCSNYLVIYYDKCNLYGLHCIKYFDVVCACVSDRYTIKWKKAGQFAVYSVINIYLYLLVLIKCLPVN